MNRLPALAFFIATLALSTASGGAETPHTDAVPAAGIAQQSVKVPKTAAEELKDLREGLAAKEAELVKLRRKWTINKGRIPTQKELEDFEKKRTKGPVTVEDNPYVNKSPLSSPGYWRKAYYDKLAEVKADREKILRLEQELTPRKP